MAYKVVTKGQLYSEQFHAFFQDSDGNYVSPFHDIPLYANKEDQIFNMVVEVPRWSNAKMEISKSVFLNPIKQDVKKGKPRFVKNLFPHKGYIWNYGAFPQTWEDPRHKDARTDSSGDNDPLDVCEISAVETKLGDVIQVKVLGVLAMIDEGETDWKVLAINTADPLSALMNDVSDIEKYKPGLLHATLEWFKYYKVPDGKPKNHFAFNSTYRNRDFALEIVSETNAFWRSLVGLPEEPKPAVAEASEPAAEVQEAAPASSEEASPETPAEVNGEVTSAGNEEESAPAPAESGEEAAAPAEPELPVDPLAGLSRFNTSVEGSEFRVDAETVQQRMDEIEVTIDYKGEEAAPIPSEMSDWFYINGATPEYPQPEQPAELTEPAEAAEAEAEAEPVVQEEKPAKPDKPKRSLSEVSDVESAAADEQQPEEKPKEEENAETPAAAAAANGDTSDHDEPAHQNGQAESETHDQPDAAAAVASEAATSEGSAVEKQAPAEDTPANEESDSAVAAAGDN